MEVKRRMKNMRNIKKPVIKLGKLRGFQAMPMRVSKDSRSFIDQFLPRTQRVIVKVKQSYNSKSSAGTWKAHGRYIERDKARSGDAFSGVDEGIKVAKTLDSWQKDGDQKLHKIILSPEYGEQLNLRAYTRELMAQAEKDLKRGLQWTAVVHKNTDNHHVHIALRGIDKEGKTLNIEKYLGSELRIRAQEIVTRTIGPRLYTEILERRDKELFEKRLTDTDRALLWKADSNLIVKVYSGLVSDWRQEKKRAQERTRLEFLVGLGVAERLSSDSYQLSSNLRETLKRLSFREQLIREQVPGWEFIKTLGRGGVIRKRLELGETLTGRVIAVDIRDPFGDREFILIDATDGNTYHINQPRGIREGSIKSNDVVTLERREAQIAYRLSSDSFNREFTAVQLHTDWKNSYRVKLEAAETLRGNRRLETNFPDNHFAKSWADESLKRVSELKELKLDLAKSNWKEALESLHFTSIDSNLESWNPRRVGQDSPSRKVVGEIVATGDTGILVKDVRDSVAKVIRLEDIGLKWAPSVGQLVSVEAKSAPNSEVLPIDYHIAKRLSVSQVIDEASLSISERRFVLSRASSWLRWELLSKDDAGKLRLANDSKAFSQDEILKALETKLKEVKRLYRESVQRQPAWIKFLKKEDLEKEHSERGLSASDRER